MIIPHSPQPVPALMTKASSHLDDKIYEPKLRLGDIGVLTVHEGTDRVA